MHRFRTILVVCEDSSTTHRALTCVRLLAKADAASVTLLTGWNRQGDQPERRPPDPCAGPVAPDTDGCRGGGHLLRPERWAASLREAGVGVSVAICDGPDTAEVIRMVLEEGYDPGVKGAGPGPCRPHLCEGDLVLLRGCPCPVWILAEEAPERMSRILATVDPDPQDPARDGLNRLVPEFATSTAEQADARLDVLNVWRLQQEAAFRHQTVVGISDEEVARIVAAEERQSASRLGLLLREFAGFSDRMTVHHRKGVASGIIPRFVHDQGVDTVVMGTVARCDMKSFFIGTIVETISGAVGGSVLMVKPESIVSPVELET